MIAVYANCTINDSNVDKFIELAQELITKTREEAGCVSYELIKGSENKNLFAFLEKWEDDNALKLHMATTHFTTIVPQLGELMDGKMDIAVHKVII